MIASPILIAMAPELLALGQEGLAVGRGAASAANELYRDISITLNGETQILLSRVIKNAPDLAKILSVIFPNKGDTGMREIYKKIGDLFR